jgi:hypothetical protein
MITSTITLSSNAPSILRVKRLSESLQSSDIVRNQPTRRRRNQICDHSSSIVTIAATNTTIVPSTVTTNGSKNMSPFTSTYHDAGISGATTTTSRTARSISTPRNLNHNEKKQGHQQLRQEEKKKEEQEYLSGAGRQEKLLMVLNEQEQEREAPVSLAPATTLVAAGGTTVTPARDHHHYQQQKEGEEIIMVPILSIPPHPLVLSSNSSSELSLKPVSPTQDTNTNSIITITHASRASNIHEVQFDTIVIREYQRILGDNPSCSSGAPISLGWAYDPNHKEFPIELYERCRDGRRRDSSSMKMSSDTREQILYNKWGVSMREMHEISKVNREVQRQRLETTKRLIQQEKQGKRNRMIKRFMRKLASCGINFRPSLSGPSKKSL